MYGLRQSTDLIPFVQLRIPPLNERETMLFAGCAAVAFAGIGSIRGMYELFRPLHKYYTQFLETRLIWTVVSSAIAYYGFGYIFVSGISRFVVIRWVIVSLVLMTIRDRRRNSLNTWLEKRKPYGILLITKNEDIEKYVKNALELYDIYKVEYEQSAWELNEEHMRVSQERMRWHDIVIVAGTFAPDILQYYADSARLHGVLFYHLSSHHLLEDLIAQPQRLGPLMVMEYMSSPLDGWRRVIKRCFDMVVSSMALVLLSPVFLIVAVLIKVDSHGPVFYIQKRVWKNGRLFSFIKFRSMYTHLSTGDNYGWQDARKLKEELVNSDANVRKGVLSKIVNDPRVTRIGRILRKTSLDELPNLFSVWRWTMSLVWPRPHEPHEVANYSVRQQRLFSIKPGMTGYAQIFGRDELPFEEEAKLDLRYIQHRSILLDLYVLVTTVKVVVKGK